MHPEPSHGKLKEYECEACGKKVDFTARVNCGVYGSMYLCWSCAYAHSPEEFEEIYA